MCFIFSELSSSPDDDLKQAIKLSLQDSGLPQEGTDGIGCADSSPQHPQTKEQDDVDSDIEFDICL